MFPIEGQCSAPEFEQICTNLIDGLGCGKVLLGFCAAAPSFRSAFPLALLSLCSLNSCLLLRICYSGLRPRVRFVVSPASSRLVLPPSFRLTPYLRLPLFIIFHLRPIPSIFLLRPHLLSTIFFPIASTIASTTLISFNIIVPHHRCAHHLFLHHLCP